ncbi:MAG: acyltransferase, partial [Tidjanibacter sp.]|nr:acyltransferase [Tidjanibacter sp.]
NLSNLRTRLGVKGNIEMLYLVDEMFKQAGNDFNITFGQPISYKLLRDMPLRDAVEYIRKESYALGKQ